MGEYMKHLNSKLALVLALSSAMLTACGGSSSSSSGNAGDNGGDTNVLKTVTLDASAGGFGATKDNPKNKYTYFNLKTGQEVDLTDAAASQSSDWHIAFKRTATKLNGGVSGPASVKGLLVDAQDDYYENGKANASVFLNASREQEEGAIKDAAISAEATFTADTNKPNTTSDGGENSWWSYNASTHQVTANDDNWFLISGAAADSWVKGHVTAIDQANRGITMELFIQGKDETAFSQTPVTYTAAIGAAGGEKCYDIDTKAEVACDAAAATWDIRVEVSADGRAWTMWTNGGVYGTGKSQGSFATDTANQASYASKTNVPGWFTDKTGGVFSDKNWYAYNLEGKHKLWPNYRVYAVDTGTEKYKVQLLSYYSTEGVSGHITFRYMPAN